jgi:hypothetical protein
MKREVGKLESLCNDFTNLTVEKQDDILNVSKRLLNIQKLQRSTMSMDEKDTVSPAQKKQEGVEG